MRTKLLAVTIGAVALMGCGTKMTVDAGTGGGFGGGGGGISGGGGGTTGGGSGGGSGRTDAGVDAGVVMGSSCANAIPIALGDQPTGEIATAGQKIFYKFSADAGEFLQITAESNPDDLSGVLDTAVTLFNETGSTKLAANDDAFPRISTDSQLFYHPATAQTFCLSVEDFSTFSPDSPPMPVARPGDIFTLTVDAIAPAAMVVNLDTEPNDMTTAPQTGRFATGMSGNFGLGLVFGTLGSATDVDVYKFTALATTTQISFDFAPYGVPSGVGKSGYGSGLDRVSVRVLTTTGTVLGQWIATAATIATTPDSIGVVIPAGSDVLLEISRPTGSTATANDFYVGEFNFSTDNPAEAADATNNVAATAEPIVFTVDPMNAKLKRGFILGTISSATDLDHYSIPVLANDTVTMACGAVRNGSGLTGTYEMLNGTTSLQTETETLDADIFWAGSLAMPNDFASKPGITATAAGTLTFKVSGTLSSTNTGSYYRCGFSVTTP